MNGNYVSTHIINKKCISTLLAIMLAYTLSMVYSNFVVICFRSWTGIPVFILTSHHVKNLQVQTKNCSTKL